jgi:hypothetical protein
MHRQENERFQARDAVAIEFPRETICRISAPLRPHRHFPNFPGCVLFLPEDGISGPAAPHLTSLKAKNGVAHLDSLSVRCLSSYLSFALNFLGTSTQAASLLRLGVLFVRRFFFLSLKSGKDIGGVQ